MLVAEKGSVRKDGQAAGIPRFQLDYRSFHDVNKILVVEPSPFAGRSWFACHLAVYFPETAKRIDEDDFGVLHLEVGVLKLASEEAILSGDWDALTKHYTFIAALLPQCGDALRDALHVSYLGNLLYGETTRNYAKARTLLPPILAHALGAVERHYDALKY